MLWSGKIEMNPGGVLQNFSRINFSEIIKTAELSDTQFLSGAFKITSSNIPERVKLGLNIGRKSKERLGTNICFAPMVLNNEILEKPFARRWGPVGGKYNFVLTIHLTQYKKSIDSTPFNVNIKIINEQGKYIDKTITAMPNQMIIIDPKKDQDLQDFLKGIIGWAFVRVESFAFDAYYFSTEGIQIGGDHAF